ncbi:hypothetical protein EDD16DRAFT_1553208 [Pisolithus croceorrhizus]|nr:hypothetical protein EDD16DRAFT_1553208 [Pisolithus croceorrhizus]
MTGSIMMTLEIRGLSARTVELWAHLPHWDATRKEPDKVGDTGGRGDDTASKDFVDLRAVEKTLLAISRSQQGEREAKWRNGLPVPPETPPNSYIHPPGTIGDPHPHGGIKTRAEKVRRARQIKMRGQTHCRDNIHGSLAISNPNEVLRHLQNVVKACWHQGVPPKSIQSSSRPMNDCAAAWQTQYKEKRAVQTTSLKLPRASGILYGTTYQERRTTAVVEGMVMQLGVDMLTRAESKNHH